jgi:hypothetical protein
VGVVTVISFSPVEPILTVIPVLTAEHKTKPPGKNCGSDRQSGFDLPLTARSADLRP